MKLAWNLVPALLVFLMGACSLSTPPVEEPQYSPLVACLASADKDVVTVLDDPDFGEQVSVTAGEYFVSASGENCRRGSVLSAGHEAEVVVICKQENGFWRLAPRIWGQGLRP